MKEVKIKLEVLYTIARQSKFYEFENIIGKYFDIPESAVKPEFEVTIKSYNKHCER